MAAKAKKSDGNTVGSSKGKGASSALLPSDQQDAIRRAAKARRRHNSNKTVVESGGLFAGIAEDRTERREATERNARQWVFESAARCIDKKTDWFEEQRRLARELLAALVGLEDADQSLLIKSGLGVRKEQRVRHWFAGAIVRARRTPRNTPGQQAEWFAAEFAAAQAAYVLAA